MVGTSILSSMTPDTALRRSVELCRRGRVIAMPWKLIAGVLRR